MKKDAGFECEGAVALEELLKGENCVNSYDEKREKPVKALSSLLRRAGLIKPVKVGRLVDYNLTEKGIDIGDKVADIIPNVWEKLPPFIFWMWGAKVMAKKMFIDYAASVLTNNFRINKPYVEKAAELMHYDTKDITLKTQAVSLFSAYACLERFKKEKPHALREVLDSSNIKAIIYN